MQKYSKNRGFSLVELIIVIAIMAILVALLAPQYIKYVEKSRLSADEELIANIHDVIAVAITDENIKNKPLDGISLCSIENMDPANKYSDFITQIEDDLAEPNLGSLKLRLKSNNFRGQPIQVKISSIQKVTVIVTSSDGSTSLMK